MGELIDLLSFNDEPIGVVEKEGDRFVVFRAAEQFFCPL